MSPSKGHTGYLEPINVRWKKIESHKHTKENRKWKSQARNSGKERKRSEAHRADLHMTDHSQRSSLTSSFAAQDGAVNNRRLFLPPPTISASDTEPQHSNSTVIKVAE